MRILSMLRALSGLGLVLLSASAAVSQPSPADMRSGTVTGSAGLQTLTLFTVPGGSTFVLTDLEWCPDMNLPFGPADILLLPLKLRTASADRYGWWARIYPVINGQTGGDRHTFNVPLVEHWTTGIVFNSGDQVRFEIGDFASFISWRISWSGYVVAGGSSDAGEPAGQDHGQLALQGSPNPAEGDATIQFLLPKAGSVLVAVYDVMGRRIRTLYEGSLAEGLHMFPWDGRNEDGDEVGEGVYFARVETPEASGVEKLTRLR